MTETAMEEAAVAAQIEGDAHEFGLHLKEGGWRLGLLVARCVQPGFMSNQHTPSSNDEGKVSMAAFAGLAGIGDHRVRRYYDAWERAAAKGKVPHADALSPGDEPDLDWTRLPRWKTFFSPTPFTGGATGPLNLTIKLGQYGDRLRRSHKRLTYFIERELPEEKLGKQTRALAGQYAGALEAEASILRRIEAGDPPGKDEAAAILDPTKFFKMS